MGQIASNTSQSQEYHEVRESTKGAMSMSSAEPPCYRVENDEMHYLHDQDVGKPSLNGLVFEDSVVPEEVLTLILSYVEAGSLPTCRLVCHTWKQVVDSQIWRYLLKKDVYKSLMSHSEARELPFYSYYLLHLRDPFNRNLIKNPSGKDLLHHWKIMMNKGDKWIVEDPPNGADKLLASDEVCDDSSCFATSFYDCYKQQEICLSELGALPCILDILKPTIHVSEWYAARFDCGSIYDLSVELLDKDKKVIDGFHILKTEEQWMGGAWHKVSHEFEYQEGICYIRFLHGGKDTQFWKGHYGSKMRNACVKIIVA